MNAGMVISIKSGRASKALEIGNQTIRTPNSRSQKKRNPVRLDAGRKVAINRMSEESGNSSKAQTFACIPLSYVIEKMEKGNRCEDPKCSSKEKRRVRCWHCGRLVCRWCWQNVHRCEPSHSKKDCRDWKHYKRFGMKWINRMRIRRGLKEVPE